MNSKYIYLVFSKTGTLFSKTLNIFSETEYLHASISFDESLNKMYSFGRINPNNPFYAGLVEENLFGGVYKKFKDSKCMIYKVKVTDEQYCCLKREVESFLKDKDEYRYNFLGLFCLLLNKPIKRKRYYYCSQFVCELLMKSNIYDSGKVPELIKTNDLFSVKNKELIYMGYTCKYNKASAC